MQRRPRFVQMNINGIERFLFDVRCAIFESDIPKARIVEVEEIGMRGHEKLIDMVFINQPPQELTQISAGRGGVKMRLGFFDTDCIRAGQHGLPKYPINLRNA